MADPQRVADVAPSTPLRRSTDVPTPGAPRSGALPTGTITFLFTDIEGSTSMWEQHPDQMPGVLARHDALLRRAIESSGGRIVKTTGDGAYAVFAGAADALAASIAIQRGLRSPAGSIASAGPSEAGTLAPISLKVRIGLHTGVAELRDSDYFGAALHRTARIMSTAHGEQILLSSITSELVRGGLPEGVTLREMGEHRLKGLLNPERLLQVVAPDLRADFPPLASITGHSLPAERDTFVGREEPLAELARRMHAGARLVSVLGMGGTGKTRLATRFGWRSLGEFPGGVWFCDLSQARNLDGIVQAVAQGLDIPLGKDDPVKQIGYAIAGREKCLVILDNFEQVVHDAEATLGRWLNRASEAQFLTTTREVLGLPGEEVLALSPLPPADAATLFVRRSEAASPAFRPNAEDQSAIVPLMKLLDGLPLAIELAAARVRVMPPRMLLTRMSERFKLLSSSGGRLDRQATLRTVFDWSWDLLSLAEKAALAQLSVFEGGFTLDSAEAVLDLSEYENAPSPVDALQSLVHKSFVRQVKDDRFDLLVSVQEYASEHLRTPERYEGSGPAALRAAETRHDLYFAGLDESAATANACAELDNFIVTCRRSAARGDANVAARVLDGAWAGLSLRGPFSIGVELARSVLALQGLGAQDIARAHGVAGRALAASAKDAEAQVAFEASLAKARETGDRLCECRALIGVGGLDNNAGRTDAARSHFEAALAIVGELSERTLESDARSGLGMMESFLGRTAEARAHFLAAHELARQARDRDREGRILANLGIVCLNAGLMDEARSDSEAALAAARDIGNRRLEGNVLCTLGLLHQVQGRFDEARDQLEAALAVARDLGHVRLECVVLCNLGMVCDSLARYDEGRDRFEAALAMARESGDRRSEGQFLSYLGLLLAHRANFGEARRCLDVGDALLREVSDRISLGILLCNRAESEHLAVEPDAARAALSAADAIANEVGAGSDSELGLALVRVRMLIGNEQRAPA